MSYLHDAEGHPGLMERKSFLQVWKDVLVKSVSIFINYEQVYVEQIALTVAENMYSDVLLGAPATERVKKRDRDLQGSRHRCLSPNCT